MEKKEPTLDQIKNAALTAVNILSTRLLQSESKKSEGTVVSRQEVDTIIRDWPGMPKKTVIEMIGKYGEPHEACNHRISWYENVPWKRTVVLRDELPHNFPLPHNDFLIQTIKYSIPSEFMGQITAFNGSILVDRTAGEVSARCDSESRNFLILNLMNDIVTGKLTVDDARKRYSDDSITLILNRVVAYADKFHFHQNSINTAEPDITLVTESMIQRAVNKIVDAIEQ
jgi:uncharacterized protein with HEPN domain